MISYIIFNTLIYGSIAFVLSACFAYAKYLNASIGSFMILSAYTISSVIHIGRNWESICIFLGSIILYWLINHIIIHYFTHERQRDLFGLIFTLGASLLIENLIGAIYGPTPISINLRTVSWERLFLILIIINFIIIYIFRKTYIGTIRKGIFTNVGSVRALGIHTQRMIYKLMMVFFPGLVLLGMLIVNQGAMRAGDNLFYTIKGIGIMIMVGVEKREYIYLGALIYVIIEYVMFIAGGLPIQYKETLILIVILIILLVRPQGLFTLKARQL